MSPDRKPSTGYSIKELILSLKPSEKKSHIGPTVTRSFLGRKHYENGELVDDRLFELSDQERSVYRAFGRHRKKMQMLLNGEDKQ